MAKVAKGSSSIATKTKAGKKAGAYVAPQPINKDKQDARLLGEVQFTAKQFPQPLPSNPTGWDSAMDSLCLHFGVRRIRRNQDRDNGYRFDATRQRLVCPPNHKEER